MIYVHGLQPKQDIGEPTWAPTAVRVSIRTAVCVVTCKQPDMRAPFKGLLGPYFRLMSINPGISFSASAMCFLPNSAKVMLAAQIEKKIVYRFFLNEFFSPNVSHNT